MLTEIKEGHRLKFHWKCAWKCVQILKKLQLRQASKEMLPKKKKLIKHKRNLKYELARRNYKWNISSKLLFFNVFTQKSHEQQTARLEATAQYSVRSVIQEGKDCSSKTSIEYNYRLILYKTLKWLTIWNKLRKIYIRKGSPSSFISFPRAQAVHVVPGTSLL